MPNKIIVICGPRGSGKSTLAKLIQKNDGGTILPFAGPIKSMLSGLVMSQGCNLDTTTRMFYGDLKNTPSEYLGDRTPAYAMQTLGTEWGRDLIHQEIWANAWKRNIERLHGFNIIVDDLRFLSEEKMIRTFENNTIVKLIRKERRSDGHLSENEYTRIHEDILIYNDTTPEDMYGIFKYHINLFQEFGKP